MSLLKNKLPLLLVYSFCMFKSPLESGVLDSLKSVPQKKRSPFLGDIQYFRSALEMESYLLNQLKEDKKRGLYEKKYKGLIKKASRVFKVPYSFQSCLIYRESRFNHKAVSPVGALGVAQFTRDTYHYLATIIKLGDKKWASIDLENKRDVEKNLHFYSSLDLNLDRYDFNKELFQRMSLLWQRYLEENKLDRIELAKENYRKVLLDPNYSIGLSAMYLYYLKYKLTYAFKHHDQELFFNKPEFMLAVAGAYNQGMRRILRVGKRSAKLNIPKWIGYQSRVKETRDYIKYIDKCMKAEQRKPAKEKLISKK